MPPSWLEEGDQVASIAGALIGLVSLLVTLRVQRRPAPSAGRATIRWAAAVAALAVLLGVAALLLGSLRTPLNIAAGACAAVTLALLLWLRIQRGRTPIQLPAAVRALLEMQFHQAEQPRYDYGSLITPGTSLTYVERKVSARRDPAVSVETMMRDSRHVVLMGGPGTGKSTLMDRLVMSAAEWWLRAKMTSSPRHAPFGPVVPVAVTARSLTGADLAGALATSWKHVEGISREVFTQPPLPRAAWLVIVDGLDEIVDPVRRGEVLRGLGAYLGTPEQPNRLVVTTRALAQGELADLVSRGAGEYRLEMFEAAELERFAVLWFTSRLGGYGDPRAEADQFLAVLRVSGLETLARVPLLATMAAMLYEASPTRTLPGGRASLYEAYITLLRGARATHEPRGEVSRWLREHMDDLLVHLAGAQVRPDGRPLIQVATEWVACHAPGAGGPIASWIGVLRSELVAAGVCQLRAEDVEFTHQSLAEYFAADPQARPFDADEWQAQMRVPSTRSLALFMLARSGQPVDRLVTRLLEGAEPDPVAAGYVLADGLEVLPPLRDKILALLEERLLTEHPSVLDCLSVLGQLVARAEVRGRLEEMALTANTPSWPRAMLADLLMAAGSEVGRRAMRDLAMSSSSGLVRQWTAARLATRSGRADPAGVPVEAVDLAGIGPLGRQALKIVAVDGHASGHDRVNAASALLRLQEPEGREVLLAVATDREQDADVRRLSALALAGAEESGSREVLAELAAGAGVEANVRHQAALALAELGDQAGVRALRELAKDRSIPSESRRLALAALTEQGDPVGFELTADADRRRQRRRRIYSLLAVACSTGLALLMDIVTSEIVTPLAPSWLLWLVVIVLALISVLTTFRTEREVMRSLSREERLKLLAGLVHRQLSTRLGSFDQTELAYRRLSTGSGASAPGSAEAFAIVGGPGSGKTTLAASIMLERLSARAPDEPVPVLLPAVTWDPFAEGLKTWIERQLRENYPGPGSLTIDDVLPVVDGVDELNLKRRERAFSCLNAAIGQGHRLVLTCRSQEYAEANAFPAGFDVLELEPLTAGQVASFLRDHLPASALPLWEPIFETLRDDPDGELAAMCSSPFMLTMLLRAYGPGGMGRNPAELLAPAQGEAHAAALISGYVFSLGWSSSYPAERVTAWLAFVAGHLDRLGTSDFAWWRLDLALRPATRLAAVGVLWLAHLAVAFVMTGASVVDLLVPASATAVVLARGALITPRSPAPRRLYSARSFAGSMRSQAWRALLTVVVSAGLLGVGAFSDGERIQAWVLVGMSVLWATIWGRWRVAAWVLAARGRLPWGLARFLEEAHRVGLLRAHGALYRFRHASLRQWFLEAR